MIQSARWACLLEGAGPLPLPYACISAHNRILPQDVGIRAPAPCSGDPDVSPRSPSSIRIQESAPRPLRHQGPRTLHLAPVETRGAQEAVADGVETTPPGGSPDTTAWAWRRRRPRGPGGAGPGSVQRRVQGGAPGGTWGAWGSRQGGGAGTGGWGLLPGAPTPGASRRQRLRFGSRGASSPSLISSPRLR